MEHELKVDPIYFQYLWKKEKLFELRKYDRDYNVGDTLRLHEYNRETKTYTGSWVTYRVSYILLGPVFGLDADSCIMSLDPDSYANSFPSKEIKDVINNHLTRFGERSPEVHQLNINKETEEMKSEGVSVKEFSQGAMALFNCAPLTNKSFGRTAVEMARIGGLANPRHRGYNY